MTSRHASALAPDWPIEASQTSHDSALEEMMTDENLAEFFCEMCGPAKQRKIFEESQTAQDWFYVMFNDRIAERAQELDQLKDY